MINKIKEFLNQVVGMDIGKIVIQEKLEFGDYSTNAAFILAKQQKESPWETAKELVKKIRLIDKEGFFEKIETAGGGFINFWLSTKILHQELLKILQNKNPYYINKKEKINIEFISANPTGPLTMANARGGFLGDVLARILEFVGYKTIREYYINDTGNQIKLLGESILASLNKLPPKEEHYQGTYIKKLAEKLKRKIKFPPEIIGRKAAEILLKQIKISVQKAGIKFDKWFSEYKNLHVKNKLKEILKILEKNNLLLYKEGAIWLKSNEIKDKDRVLIKSDGLPTYFLADLAYHYDKFIKRKFDKAIDIWGADHHGYIARLKFGLKALKINPEKLRIIITQLVHLIEKGREKRMSKRKGEFVTLDYLIKEVGVNAARFFFLMYSPDTHMDFDLALAKERSVKNPVFYVQYAYVRCNSILNKVRGKRLKVKSNGELLNLLKNKNELNLIRELIKLPDIIDQIVQDYQINHLTRYAIDLSRVFHNFYEKEKVIVEDKDTRERRLALVLGVKIVFENLFKVLGITAPKKM